MSINEYFLSSYIGNKLLIKMKIIKCFLFQYRYYKKWIHNGKPIPPPHLAKRDLIRKYQILYDLHILIETGTYLGEMIYAMKDYFDLIRSIEIEPNLYNAAKKRFVKYNNIEIFFGDSGRIMPKIIEDLKSPALFWLDGHYSGGISGKGELNSPIYSELDAIFANNRNHIILIDDVNCFNGKDGYPTIEMLYKYILIKNNQYSIKIESNVFILELSGIKNNK